MAITLNGTTGITTPAISSTGSSTFTGSLALPSGGLTVGTDQLAVDSAGRVTMPYQPFFQGYIDSLLTVATSSAKVASNIVVTSNVGGHWANYRFTCPVAGVYEVHSGWMKETSATLAIHWDVSINGQGGGASRRIRSWEGTGYYYVSNTWLITLSANDYIEFYAYANGAGQQIYEQHSSIYIRLVG